MRLELDKSLSNLLQGHLFRCTQMSPRLFPSHVRCDGYPDCPGGEDELGCEEAGYHLAQPVQESRFSQQPWHEATYPQSQAAYPQTEYGYPQSQPEATYTRPPQCFTPPPGPSACPLFWLQPTPRWFFNPQTRSCSQFQYKCGQGFNNFDSFSNCR